MLDQAAGIWYQPQVAIVDDDPEDCLWIERCLKRGSGSAIHTTTIHSYDDALSLLGSQSFEGALIDLDLGASTGFDLITQLGGRGATTPMIVITGRASRDMDERAAEVGAYAFLEKDSLTYGSLERALRYARRAHAAERTLQEMARAALQATSAKSDFLARMSHDFRTPLNAILGFAEMLESQAYGAHSEARTVEYARYIAESGRHLLDLVNNVLSLTRIESGRYELKRVWLDLGEVLPPMLRLVAGAAAKKAIRVTMTLNHGGRLLLADPTALKQMIVNLLSNAVKFTPEGGRIELVASLSDREMHIGVRDNGIGMSAADINVALSPFGQIRRSHDVSQDGSGLGLPIVKSLVECHGGRFLLLSRLDHGTQAILAFPADAVSEPVDDEAAAIEPPSDDGSDPN